MKPQNDFKLDGARPLPEKALEVLNHLEPSRRDFLKTAGVMMIGFGVGAATTAGTAEAQSPLNPSGNIDATQLDSWVAIGADESITVFAGKAELGTGVKTMQIQIAAEELSVPVDRITMVLCRSGVTPNQGLTVGSLSSVTQFGNNGLRVAVDTARDALYQLAARYFNVPVEQLALKDGVFSLSGDPVSTVSYGELVQGQRFNLPVNRQAVPNNPSTWKVIGTSVPRVDVPPKAKGTYQYVQKVKVPGMLHGKVIRPPALGAHVQKIDNSVLNGLPGNPQVVQVNDWVGVVADTEWNAIKAANALIPAITWSQGDTIPNQADLYTWMQQQPTRNSLSVNTGDVDQVMASAAKIMTAQYRYPYQMHGSLAASAAVVDVRGKTGDTATVKAWSCTQSVYNMRTTLANLLRIPAANIEVVFVEGSGCYGHNGGDPVTQDAALFSQAVGKPVRVLYSRADEMIGGEHYGYPMVSNEKIGLDATGQIIAWDYENIELQRGEGALGTPGNNIPGYLAGFPTTAIVPSTSPPANPTTFGNGNNTVPPYVSGRVNGVNFYTGTVLSHRVLNKVAFGPLWTAWLRSPHRLQNTFAHECFMDEIAASLNVDPIQYRLRHLVDPRLIDAVNAVAQKAKWDTRPSPKVNNPIYNTFHNITKSLGRGFACYLHQTANGYAAMAAEVSVNESTGEITVTKVTTSIDSGPVVHPDGLTNQVEGQVIQGISRTLYEEVLFDRASSSITTKDWRTYSVLKFGDRIPEIVTILINSLSAPVAGSGEITITLVAAAIGNAIYDATGVRMRQVPFTADAFLAAKKEQKG